MEENVRLVSAVFPDISAVKIAYQRLLDLGIRPERVNFIGAQSDIIRSDQRPGETAPDAEERPVTPEAGMATGAAVGTAVGVLGGMLLAPIFFPAAGLVIAGPLVGGLVGTGVATTTQSVREALISTGMSEAEAVWIDAELKRGGTAMIVEATPEQAREAEPILREHGGRLLSAERVQEGRVEPRVEPGAVATKKRGPQQLVGVLFPDRASAERSVQALPEHGIEERDVSLVGPTGLLTPPAPEGGGDRYYAISSEHPHLEDAAIGAMAGGAVGFLGGMGLLLSGAMVLPAIGLAVAGPLVGALAVAGLNRHSKSLIEALREAGVPEAEAHHLESRLKAGNILLAVTVDANELEHTRNVLRQLGGEPVWQEAAAGYR